MTTLVLLQPNFGLSLEPQGNSNYEKGLEFKADGKLDSAFFYLLQALEDFPNCSDERCLILNQTGIVVGRANGGGEQSMEFFRQALHCAENSGLFECRIKAINNIGTTYFQFGELSKADSCWKNSWQIANSPDANTDIKNSCCRSLLNQASLLYQIDSLDKADEYISLAESNLKSDSTVKFLISNLRGLVAMDRTEWGEAESEFKLALSFARDLKQTDYELKVVDNLATLYENSEDFKMAIAYRDSAYHLAQEFALERQGVAVAEIQQKFDQAQTAATLAQKQQNRLLLLISALVIAGVVLFMYARRQKAIRKAQTAAVLQAREQEQKRISQRLWQEIGKAMQQRDEQTSVFDGDQKTLDGAVQAAKYLSAQHFNPYLQVSLSRALEFGCEQYGIQYGALITTEVEDVDIPMAQRKQLYKAFKRTLLDHLDTQGVDKLHVEMHAKEGRVELAITANEAPEKSVLYTAAEAEVAALGGKLKSKSEGASHRTRIKVPIQG